MSEYIKVTIVSDGETQDYVIPSERTDEFYLDCSMSYVDIGVKTGFDTKWGKFRQNNSQIYMKKEDLPK
jgi:hypothetical protein